MADCGREGEIGKEEKEEGEVSREREREREKNMSPLLS